MGINLVCGAGNSKEGTRILSANVVTDVNPIEIGNESGDLATTVKVFANDIEELTNRNSFYTKVIRIVVWILKGQNKCTHSDNPNARLMMSSSIDQLYEALLRVIWRIQRVMFCGEFKCAEVSTSEAVSSYLYNSQNGIRCHQNTINLV